ncbi:MAG: hypothetical protein A3I66_22255 [Burkholderiales bacterium RIFCSPLOWO2_02_FULL_57_36]|nr:MAG: hypothetical protein A3I66_22255 [Burkholderiales bacterium RIFCSPLOWO2_02_FULL_57_36]
MRPTLLPRTFLFNTSLSFGRGKPLTSGTEAAALHFGHLSTLMAAPLNTLESLAYLPSGNYKKLLMQ